MNYSFSEILFTYLYLPDLKAAVEQLHLHFPNDPCLIATGTDDDDAAAAAVVVVAIAVV